MKKTLLAAIVLYGLFSYKCMASEKDTEVTYKVKDDLYGQVMIIDASMARSELQQKLLDAAERNMVVGSAVAISQKIISAQANDK